MSALRRGRLGRGWSMSEAASHTGVSRPMLSLLERGQRRPSESVAEDLIDAYGLDDDDADAVRAIARPLVGRDSPYRTGVWPEPDLDKGEAATDLFPVRPRATVPGAPAAGTAEHPATGAEAWIAWAKRKAEAAAGGVKHPAMTDHGHEHSTCPA